MTSQVEYEALNVVPPMRNATGIRGIANVVVSTTSQDINLADHFGNIGAGHYFTFQADGAKIYVAFGPGAGAINDQEQGAGSGVCFPIADGQSLPVRLLGGNLRTPAYGSQVAYATQMLVGSGYFVKAKLALSGASTGFLRIYRSSVGPDQDVSQFPLPTVVGF